MTSVPLSLFLSSSLFHLSLSLSLLLLPFHARPELSRHLPVSPSTLARLGLPRPLPSPSTSLGRALIVVEHLRSRSSLRRCFRCSRFRPCAHASPENNEEPCFIFLFLFSSFSCLLAASPYSNPLTHGEGSCRARIHHPSSPSAPCQRLVLRNLLVTHPLQTRRGLLR